MLKRLYNWRKTKQGALTFGGLSLVLAYIVFSLAIDSGSIFQYLVAIVLIIAAVQDFFQANKANGKKHRSKKTA